MAKRQYISDFQPNEDITSSSFRRKLNDVLDVVNSVRTITGDGHSIGVNHGVGGVTISALATDDVTTESAVASSSFWARITGTASAVGTTNEWVYDFVGLERSSGGFTSGTPTAGTAINSIEAPNDGSGVEGNSINVSGEGFGTAGGTSGFFLKEVRGAPVVRMWSETVLIGTVATALYTFEYVNQIDGTCP